MVFVIIDIPLSIVFLLSFFSSVFIILFNNYYILVLNNGCFIYLLFLLVCCVVPTFCEMDSHELERGEGGRREREGERERVIENVNGKNVVFLQIQLCF